MRFRKKLVFFFLLLVKTSFSQGLFIEHGSPCDSSAASSVFAFGLDSGLVSSQFSLKLVGGNSSNVSIDAGSSNLPYQASNFNVIGDTVILHSWFSFNLQPFTSAQDTLFLFDVVYSAWPDSIIFVSSPLAVEFIDKNYNTYNLSLQSAIIEDCDSINHLSLDYGGCQNGVKQPDTLVIVPSALDVGKAILFSGTSYTLQLPETKIPIDTSKVLQGDTVRNSITCSNCIVDFSADTYNPTFCSSTAAFQLQLMNSVGCSGDSIQTIVVANNDAQLTGFQFALKYELASQSISSALVESPLIGSWGAGNYNISNDSVVRISWFSVTPNDFNQGDTLVSIRFANPDASLNTASIDSSIMAVEFLNNTATLIPWSISDSLLNCLEIGCTFLNSQCAGQSRTDSIKVQIINSNFSFVYFDGTKVPIVGGQAHFEVTSGIGVDSITLTTDTLINGDFLRNSIKLPALNCGAITLSHIPQSFDCNFAQSSNIFVTGITDTVSIDVAIFLNPAVGEYITHADASNVISNKVNDSLYFSLIAYPDDTIHLAELEFRYIDSGQFVVFSTTEINSVTNSFSPNISSDYKQFGCDNNVNLSVNHQVTPCYSRSTIVLTNALNVSSFQLALKIDGLPAKIDSIDPQGHVSNLIGDSIWLLSGINNNTANDTLVLGHIYWSGLDSSSSLLYSLDSSIVATEVIRNNVLQSVIVDLDTILFETALPIITPLFSGASICFGDSIKLRSNYSSFDSLIWNDGSAGEFLWIKGNGLIELYGYAGSCIDTLEYFENRFDSCDVQIQYAQSAICPGDSLELSLNGNYASYLWSNGSTASTIYISTPGNYSVQVVDNNGSTLNSGTVNISVFSVQSSILSPSNNQEICFEDSLQLSISPASGVALWSDGTLGFENWIYTPGSYYAIVTDANGCKSFSDSITVTKRPFPLQGSRNLSGCDSVQYEGNWISSPTTFLDTTSTILGCDSSFLVNVSLLQSSYVVDSIVACGEYKWINGLTYTQNNTSATYTLSNSSGCDSLVQLNLEILPEKFSIDQVTACGNYTWIDGNTYSSNNNTASVSFTAANGCDSVVLLNLTILPQSTWTDVITACGSYTWIDGTTYTSSTNTATTTLTASNGCDSVVTLDLTINTTLTGTDIITTCGSYTWIDGTTYTSSNYVATDTLSSLGGCDSIVYLNLTIVPNISTIDQITACGSYTWINGITYTSSNYSDTVVLSSQSGCDSIITLDLTINPPYTGTAVITACESYTWIDGNTYFSDTDTATILLTAADGCDSIVTLDLTITQPSTGIDSVEACGSFTWIDGNTYTSNNNTATTTLTASNGCDSIITLNLEITNTFSSTDVISACGSYTWINGNTYSASTDTVTTTLTASNGCDSIITLDLTIIPPVTGVDVISACGSYTWIDGNTYTSSDTSASITLTSSNGCDSIVTLNLTITNSITSSEVITACGSFTWIDGNTYTSSDTSASITLIASNGCDSVVNLDLTIIPPANGIDSVTACGSYTWIDGNTYTSNNSTAVDTLTGSNGCDSIVTLNLVITNTYATTDVVTACSSYTWINGNTYTASTDTVTTTLLAANGCDSIVTLDLTINSPVTSTEVVTACGSYTWINGNTYTSNTITTDTLIASTGCDSIVTLDLTINSPSIATETVSACDFFTWINGITYTSSNNTDSVLFIASNGCDSILYLNLTILQSKSSIDSVEACNSFTWINGVTYLSDNNNASVTFTAQNGCDSVVYLDLTISNINTSVQSSGDTLVAPPNQTFYQWMRCETGSYSPIAGATSNTFTPTSKGQYAVRIVNGACTDTSSCVFFSGLGMNESKLSIKIYPNPSKGILNIKSDILFIGIKIYDSSGREVFDSKIEQPSKEISLNLENLKSGFYSIQLIGEERVYSETLIISY